MHNPSKKRKIEPGILSLAPNLSHNVLTIRRSAKAISVVWNDISKEDVDSDEFVTALNA